MTRKAPTKAKSKLSQRVKQVQVRRRRSETNEDRSLRGAMTAVAGPSSAIVLSQKRTPARGAALRARYDAAQTSDDNRRHWAMADSLAPNDANSPSVRTILRNRSRYEVANNTYARGIVLTLANDTMGTGPRLQMLLDDGEDLAAKGINGLIEREFATWAKAIDLPGKLRTMRMSCAQDGEAFAMLVANGTLQTHVKLDLRLIEAEQVTTTDVSAPAGIDGIVLDEYGNPQKYWILKDHPGSSVSRSQMAAEVSAEHVIHWFRADRPGQMRGVPEITPALPLFAQLRRYTLAVLDAAEAAADFAIVLFTKSPAGGDAEPIDSMDTIELARRMMTTMPEGWEPGQIKPEQPATTYAEFKREILNEIARCLNMPYNIAACNSSSYNYSSGRLDHQTYYKAIRVNQAHCEAVVLDRILGAWMVEAVKVYPELAGLNEWPHQWFWDGHEHVDPAKEANAQATRLASNTTTLASEYAKQGKDWETELRQRAKEVKLMMELGLTVAQTSAQNEDEDEEEGNADQPTKS